MTLWWIANAVGALVVLPVVVYLANRVIVQAREIRRYAEEILEHGVRLTGTLDPLPALADTRDGAQQVASNALRYVAALNRMI